MVNIVKIVKILIYFNSELNLSKCRCFRINLVAAMGIGGGIQQCLRKCRPMLVLRRQKKCRRKGFHICGLSFQVLQCC